MTFEQCKKEWSFADEAINGDGGFLNGGYIDKYPRESDTKYKKRQSIAYYTNFFASKVDRYIGYLFKQSPTRTTKNDMIKRVFDDCNNKGDSMDVFISSFAKRAKARGVSLVLVDMPKTIPSTLKEQIDSRALPYLVEIPPQSIKEYKLDKFGRFEYVIINDILTDEKNNKINITRYYDTKSWAVKDEGGKVLDSGEYSIGVCPVLIFSESGEFPSTGEFTQIASLSKRYYNLKSELDEVLRGQTFSFLAIETNQSQNEGITLSIDNAITHPVGTKPPVFIAPPAAPAEIYQKEIENIEETIDKIAYDVSTNQSKESGIALSIKFQGLNSSLSNFALRLNDLESRIFDVVCRFLGISDDVTISYPKTFDIIDIDKEIAILSEMKDIVTSPTYFKLKALQIISNDLNTINPDDFAKIESEIEDSFKGG